MWSLIKDYYSSAPDSARLVNTLSLTCASLGVSPWYGYVPSESDGSDILSRFSELGEAGMLPFLGSFVPMRLPSEADMTQWEANVAFLG